MRSIDVKMRTMSLVVFDLAGTNVEDRGQVLEAFTAAQRESRIAVTEAEL